MARNMGTHASLNAQRVLVEDTVYIVTQINGQRKCGPPPDWEGSPPPRGCEVFIRNIPHDAYENELLPLFHPVGRIYEFRLMMDYTGSTRGFAFVNYSHEREAISAIERLDNHTLRPGHSIRVLMSMDKRHIYIGGLPQDKCKMEILERLNWVTDGIEDVILGPVDDRATRPTNYGFVYVQYISHDKATMARRKLMRYPFYLWDKLIDVQWPDPGEVAMVQDLRHSFIPFPLF
uniref:probable RNA-binding protein 46 n=1 Tax=Myxine glutinosa TaxID=7769 RepID=UPI00358FCED1